MRQDIIYSLISEKIKDEFRGNVYDYETERTAEIYGYAHLETDLPTYYRNNKKKEWKETIEKKENQPSKKEIEQIRQDELDAAIMRCQTNDFEEALRRNGYTFPIARY